MNFYCREWVEIRQIRDHLTHVLCLRPTVTRRSASRLAGAMQTKWASFFGTPFHSIASSRTENLFFFLLLSALIRWDCSALRLCLFHRLPIFFGTLSADLGPLLAFLV